MAIETQLYPSNTGFQFYGSQFNSQQQLDPALVFLPNPNATDRYSNNQPLSNSSQSLPVDFDGHRNQIDQYIRSQNEKLRIMLQEQTKQQVLALSKMMEPGVLNLLSQKDEQIAKAAKKKTELEEFLRRLEAENQLWRRVAQENEAVVLSLHNTLEQVKERNRGVIAEDAESYFCDDNRVRVMEEEGTGESRLCFGNGGVGKETEQITMVCKCCHSRKSCSMFLPCRHLCCCKACESFLQACPVCKMPKKTSIETLIF